MNIKTNILGEIQMIETGTGAESLLVARTVIEKENFRLSQELDKAEKFIAQLRKMADCRLLHLKSYKQDGACVACGWKQQDFNLNPST